MLRRTHLAIGLCIVLYFLPHVNNKLLFIPVLLISSLLPDLDSSFSFLGKRYFARPIQMLSSHRGMLHSYSFCIAISLLFAIFYPILALPFFLGYSFHLLADSFTIQGIKPFWPLRYNSSGNVRVGGRIEYAIFFVFIILDIFLFLFLFINK